MAFTSPNPEAQVRLFCFPAAGAGASLFRQWPALFPTEVEVCPVRRPAEETRWGEKPFTRLTALVEELRSGLLPCFDKPFAFFGCSLGAILAFELARLLLRRDRASPVHLFVAAMVGPPFVMKRRLHDLPEQEFRAQLRELGGTPPEVLENEELMSLLAPLLRADFALAETYTYQPAPTIGCPISAYGGLEDVECPEERLADWKPHTTGSFRRRVFPGGHFFLNSVREELIGAIIENLRLV